MAEAADTQKASPFHRWKKHFPVLAEIMTSLVGAFSSDIIRDFIKETFAKPASESIKKTVRSQFPDWKRSMADEGLFSILMEQIDDNQKKALEGFLARKTNFKQRVDFILSMAEQLCPVLPGIDQNSPEGREAWKTERAKALAAAISYLKYLANLGDDEARERSLLSRNFMRPQNEYPTTTEFLGKIKEKLDLVDNSVFGRGLRVKVRTLSREVARKRAELASGMTWREKLSFFSLTGRRPAPATATVNAPGLTISGTRTSVIAAMTIVALGVFGLGVLMATIFF
jgi:hypothetical protein